MYDLCPRRKDATMYEWNPTGSSGVSVGLDARLIGVRPDTLAARLYSASGAEQFIM